MFHYPQSCIFLRLASLELSAGPLKEPGSTSGSPGRTGKRCWGGQSLEYLPNLHFCDPFNAQGVQWFEIMKNTVPHRKMENIPESFKVGELAEHSAVGCFHPDWWEEKKSVGSFH